MQRSEQYAKAAQTYSTISTNHDFVEMKATNKDIRHRPVHLRTFVVDRISKEVWAHPELSTLPMAMACAMAEGAVMLIDGSPFVPIEWVIENCPEQYKAGMRIYKQRLINGAMVEGTGAVCV